MVGYKIPPSIAKSRHIQEAFEAKVAILESWALNGLPDEILLKANPDGSFSGDVLPRDNAKLMRWRGPKGNLATWVDPSISRPRTGKYPEMAERFALAIKAIDDWIHQRKGVVPELERKVEVLDATVKRLAVQNTKLIATIQQLREELATAKAMPTGTRR